ncbi:MAG: hypothetical protein J6K55_14285 [Clostridia bacterium]|nr:hypothetical protein [Clostridia bacterium]
MEKERSTDCILQRLIELYVTYRQKYILCLPNGRIITPKKKGEGYCKLSDSVLRNHLEHRYAVGIFAGEVGSKFICFDVDDGNHETVRSIIDELVRLGFQEDMIYTSYSGGKGYHVEMYFNAIIRTDRLRMLYEHVVAAHKLDPHKVEFRPTNTSAIKLPLSIHAKTGNVCWYVDNRTFQKIESNGFILQIKQMDAVVANKLIPQQMLRRNGGGKRNRGISDACRSSPATRNLGTELREEGTRHNMMRNIVVFQRQQGSSKQECQQILRQWYEQQNHSFVRSMPEDVARDMEDLIKWAYSDSFLVRGQNNSESVTINSAHIEVVLRETAKNRRRMLFLLMVRSKMGRRKISAKDAGKVIGVSQNTACKLIKKLVDNNAICAEKGKRM